MVRHMRRFQLKDIGCITGYLGDLPFQNGDALV
jgi:hypothetical protein